MSDEVGRLLEKKPPPTLTDQERESTVNTQTDENDDYWQRLINLIYASLENAISDETFTLIFQSIKQKYYYSIVSPPIKVTHNLINLIISAKVKYFE